jgi:hypothetical protein
LEQTVDLRSTHQPQKPIFAVKNAYNVSSAGQERPERIGKTSGPRTSNSAQTATKRGRSISIARFANAYGLMISFKRQTKELLRFLNSLDSLLLPNSKNIY